ncbi:MAG: MFS transporter [Ruminococcaceae bacterium]|nr:MFS transporter [Oscillospiraceae bacterium]
MKTKLPRSFWCALTIFSLMGQIAWVVENMYFNVFIYKMFNASADDISLMVAASAVTATLTTVFIGALSDRIGKRKLFICLGYILWGVSIFSFVFLREDIISKTFATTSSATAVGVSLAIILDCVMTFFGSSANDAAFNAWLTDSTDDTNQGAAEGINSMMPLVSILVVFGGFMFFDLDKAKSWSLIFTIIGVLVIVIGILGFFLIKEPKIVPSKEPYFKSIFYGFRPKTIKENGLLYVVMAAFVIFNISIQIFMPYLIIYYEVSLGMKDYVLIMAPAILIAAVVTAFWGRLFDKKGFTFSGIIAVVMLLLGYVILFVSKTTIPVFIGSLFMMCGYLAGMAVFGAMIRNRTPEGKSGRLQGVRIFSQVLIPGVVGPYIGKMVLRGAEMIKNSDGTESFVPNENIFMAAGIALLAVIPLCLLIKKLQKPRLVQLETEYEKVLKEASGSKTFVPFAEYPRPQLKRASYECLNGEWRFKIQGKKELKYDGSINVPFVPESRISGVFKSIDKRDILIYERTFNVDNFPGKERLILHFGACDLFAEVFVNGKKAGESDNGYLSFEFDITEFAKAGENSLKVIARDPLDIDYPYGKQTEKRGGMWYTKFSGIWQTVWLERVPAEYIKGIKIVTDLKGADITVLGGAAEKLLILNGKEYKFSGEKIRIDIENPVLWTPENPYLYEFMVRSGDDTVSSYFGLRTVSIENVNDKPVICLNGVPVLFHGLLDQGYFSDGIILPATPQGFVDDILRMKSCGFNMLRKHIKIEPDLFYYYCDKYGMIVFQDMINSGKYSFLIDTALPTIGLKKGISHKATAKRREAFEKTCSGVVDALYNHPSVVYYTIFNEGWGQFDEEYFYNTLKEKDPSRIYDTTSGWFKTDKTDVESDHVYFKKLNLKKAEGRPMVLSEFGGYSCKIEGHSFNLDETYGYRFFDRADKFENALCSLYTDEVIPHIKNGLCALVLTQVSDVEDETNGLLTYDRKVLKVNEERLSVLSGSLYNVFDETFNR